MNDSRRGGVALAVPMPCRAVGATTNRLSASPSLMMF